MFTALNVERIMKMRDVVDVWLDRGLKSIGIVGFLGAAFMAVNGVLTIPRSLAENDQKIRELQDYRTKTDLTLQAIQQDASYTKEQVKAIIQKIDRIYELVKA